MLELLEFDNQFLLFLWIIAHEWSELLPPLDDLEAIPPRVWEE
jgi:hypothetical protein